jgi:phytoene synthase
VDKKAITGGATTLQSSTQDARAHCKVLVRAADKDRFLAGLYASVAKRAHLYSLYAFAHEIARVSDVARQPMAGEIRLQWWRDALAGERAGEALANPVAAAILSTTRECALPTEPLIALIDAHAFDLYDDAMSNLAELDRYTERTAGALFALGARILGGNDEPTIAAAAAPAGIAYAVAHRLRAFPHDVARRQLFVPLDLLARHGVTREEIEARRNSAGLRSVLAALREHARAAFDRLRCAVRAVPDPCAPAFLPAATVPLLLARLEAAAADPFTLVDVPQWRRQWAIWSAARNWPAL